MKRIVLTYGLISGAILAGMTALMVPLCMNETMDFDHSEIVGYTTMFLSFLLVFFGIRSYRENINGGTITFGRAFKIGILITLITCSVYVVSWEIVYFNFLPDFGEKYTAHMLAKMQKDGESQAAIAKATVEMARFKKLYKNPLFNAGMTLMEVLPVGLIMTLVSAAILRRSTPPTPAATPAIA
jgi:hypothetical protein